MDIILIVVTAVSLAIAAGLAVVVWRFYREESGRTDARIAALNEMALGEAEPIAAPPVAARAVAAAPIVAEPIVAAPQIAAPPIGARTVAAPPIVLEPIVAAPPIATAAVAQPRAAEAPVRPRVEAPPRPRTQPSLDLPLHPASPAATPPTSTLFREQAHASPWGARAVVMAGLGLAAAAIVLFALTARNSAAMHSSPPVATAAAAAPGLELLSLRDARQNGTLTITGLVQNPRSGTALTRVVVTAFTFDANGSFLASGRAPLDYTTLQPGDESPFVVTVAVPSNVARYRIGFRGDDGRVIAHVDKRQATTAVAENRP